ncbi:substrate-binding periplasmic protein [Roseateles sp.]|uniref:substrate-binding periplasmic protein n=1 Tax=Roseateles sp. TaxID=1971397 RepID=UPI003BA8A588
MCLSQLAWAQPCSRAVRVPVASAGFNVRVIGDRVDGVYPDLLRQIGRALDCQFVFPVVPRARVTMMFFESQEADLFLPASRNSERDQKAQFVPMLKLSPTLISLANRADVPTDVRSLLSRSTWRAAMVRSYSWGDEYERLMRQLEAEKRVDYVSDLRTVGAMLRGGRVEFTILPPTLLYSALQEGRSDTDAGGDFRFTELQGLPRSEVGAYISRRSLNEVDQQVLREALSKAARDGSLQRTLQLYYPPEVLLHDAVLP